MKILKMQRKQTCLRVSRFYYPCFAGWDDFLALLAKQSIESYIEPLTCFINRSFLEGIFPIELKLARVVQFLYQVTLQLLIIIFCQSILSFFFAKIYEKLLYKYILDFLDANRTIYKHQFGFREKHSTQQTITSPGTQVIWLLVHFSI